MQSIVRASSDRQHAAEPTGIPILYDGERHEYRLSEIGKQWSQAAKRGMDLAGASALILLTAPLLAAVALLVRLDGGRALFRHERIGRGGRPFVCYKFRTMVVDAEARLARLLTENPRARAEWLADQKLRDDPRVTPIGRWLRRTSMDELPQLLNVLRGDMSLVGPRPVVRDELARYGAEIPHYLRERPGLTGLWQVSGRNDLTYEDRVRLDGWYLRNKTLVGDLKILVRTCWIVVHGRGAR
jgi:lipopolysaccharide/colanic/teichoic acid biosynthesis glycosyltransferase